MRQTCRDVWRFVRAHWWHLLLLPVMVFVFTVLHEGAHALAVVVQGGEVLAFSVWPTDERFGFIRYTFDGSRPFSPAAVSLAPYAMWVGFMIGSVVLAMYRRGYPFAIASFVFCWCYAAAWLDVLYNASGWLDDHNDFAHAFGPPTKIGFIVMMTMTIVVLIGSYFVHRRLYGHRALNIAGYALLVGGCIVIAGLALLTQADQWWVNHNTAGP